MTLSVHTAERAHRSVYASATPMGERRASGRAARARVPCRRLADWDPATRGHDALGTVLAQNETRVPDLVPIRMSRMSASPWTYFRGAAAVMAADLGAAPHTGIEVQLCGDAHVLNFGLWATPERQLSFDLRDFDETVRGPFEWDVKRYLASLVVLARDVGLDDRIGLAAVRAALQAYRARIAHYSTADELTIWYDVITSDELLAAVRPGGAGTAVGAVGQTCPATDQRGRGPQAYPCGGRAAADRRRPPSTGAHLRNRPWRPRGRARRGNTAGLSRQPAL